jgi:MoxR-like ATPase
MTDLIFDTQFHNADQLITKVKNDQLNFNELNDVAAEIQNNIDATQELEKYALNLWKATIRPQDFNVKIQTLM